MALDTHNALGYMCFGLFFAVCRMPSITRPLLQWALSVAPDVSWVEFRCVEGHGTKDASGSHRSHQSCHHGQDDKDRVVCNGKEL